MELSYTSVTTGEFVVIILTRFMVGVFFSFREQVLLYDVVQLGVSEEATWSNSYITKAADSQY